MKRYINIVLSLIAGVTLTACVEEFEGQEISVTPDGFKTLEFVAQVPDMNVVQTKAVDPDGAGVQTCALPICIFCSRRDLISISDAAHMAGSAISSFT